MYKWALLLIHSFRDCHISFIGKLKHRRIGQFKSFQITQVNRKERKKRVNGLKKEKKILFLRKNNTEKEDSSYPTLLSAPAGWDTRLSFKRSLTSLNSEFSVSLTGCHRKIK